MYQKDADHSPVGTHGLAHGPLFSGLPAVFAWVSETAKGWCRDRSVKNGRGGPNIGFSWIWVVSPAFKELQASDSAKVGELQVQQDFKKEKW